MSPEPSDDLGKRRERHSGAARVISASRAFLHGRRRSPHGRSAGACRGCKKAFGTYHGRSEKRLLRGSGRRAIPARQRSKEPAGAPEMTYVIAEPCINTKDTACVEVCPVDCIHPTKSAPDFDKHTMLYINPDECIDCGACGPECPVDAIFDEP